MPAWGQFPRLLELIPHHLTVKPGGSIPQRSLCPGTRASVSKGVSVYRGISMLGQGQITRPEAFSTLE